MASARWHEDAEGKKVVEMLNVLPLKVSLETTNRFALSGKSPIHYLVLALAAALPILSLSVLALCVRSSLPRRPKILWSLSILLGFVQLSLNWTNGGVSTTPLAVQFLSAGWHRLGLLGPHIISVSIPVFALLFLVRRPDRKPARL